MQTTTHFIQRREDGQWVDVPGGGIEDEQEALGVLSWIEGEYSGREYQLIARVTYDMVIAD